MQSSRLNIRWFWKSLERAKKLTFDRAVSRILSPVVDMATVTDVCKVKTKRAKTQQTVSTQLTASFSSLAKRQIKTLN